MRSLMKWIGIPAVLLAGTAIILGNDFRPWAITARQSAKKQLLSMVDEYELKIQQVRGQIEAMEETVVENARQKSRLESLVSRLEYGMDDASADVELHRSQLRSLQARLTSGGHVFTAEGDRMTNAQIQRSVRASTNGLRLAKQRSESLAGYHQICRQHLSKLEDACERAPQDIASLRDHCGEMVVKIQLAKEMRDWAESAETLPAGDAISPASIADSLAKLDAEIEADIAGFKAKLDLRSPDAPTEVPFDHMVMEITRALGPEEDSNVAFLLED